MTIEQVREVVGYCAFCEYQFHVLVDGRGGWYLRATYDEADIDTGVVAAQWTRRWYLSPAMLPSEVVQTLFKCALTSMEHRTREFFLYRGRAVFGPHHDVEALWSICPARQERLPAEVQT